MLTRAIVLAHRLTFQGARVSEAALHLLRQTLDSLNRCGIKDVCLIDGEHADLLAERLELSRFENLTVQVLANESWRKASGSAALVARDFLAAGECLILRGDRPLATRDLELLARGELASDLRIVLAPTPEKVVDLSGEPKVLLDERDPSVVARIGLDLTSFDAVFTGHARVRPCLVSALEAMPNPGLEDGISELLKRGAHVDVTRGAIAWPQRHAQTVDDSVAALLDAKNHPSYTLLNPGPVRTTPRVKSALVHHDISHRDTGFSDLLVSLSGKLRRVFRASAEHTIALVTGSGTAAMECSIASCVANDQKILIVDNGAFGERLLEIAQLHQLNIVHLKYDWGEMVQVADIEKALADDPDIGVVAMVHHETSVGLLNPVRDVGAACRHADALFVVDAVSSLGAEDLDVIRDNIDVCYSSANKCLHAVSGVGFLCVHPDVWPRIESIRPRSYYLDLRRYRYYMEELAQTPFTPAVSNYFALDAACAEFLADGHERRFTVYADRNRYLRDGLSSLGMHAFTDTGFESHSLVTCSVPEGVSYRDFYQGLKARGFIVYGCKHILQDRYLQVANMGDIDRETIDRFFVAAQETIAECSAQLSDETA